MSKSSARVSEARKVCCKREVGEVALSVAPCGDSDDEGCSWGDLSVDISQETADDVIAIIANFVKLCGAWWGRERLSEV